MTLQAVQPPIYQTIELGLSCTLPLLNEHDPNRGKGLARHQANKQDSLKLKKKQN